MDGMTDEELAAKLEEHAKHGSHAYPDLLSEASERLYALSAHVALLKASLAQAEREAGAAVAAEREACADAESDAGRLALELECLLLSISDMPTVSRWWESANEALDLHRSRLDSIRARGEKGGE